ncbi:MAG: PEP-CTERM sorting domain-containing protein [Luteolibacter sp.]
MKKTLTTLSTGLLLTGAANAASLLLPDAGQYNGGETVVTSLVGTDGATFDVTYTLGVTANAHLTDPGANPVFINSTGTIVGVGGGNDIVNHINTLEGNDNEGLSFTTLTLSNFVAGTLYTEAEYTNSLSFEGFSVASAGNANDGVNISYGAFGVTTDNENLNNNGAGAEFIPLAGRTEFVTAGSSASNLFLIVDSGQSNNRWSVSGLEVSFVPEPSSSAMLLGGLGMLALIRRRK